MAINYSHRTNPYATHQPVLVEAIRRMKRRSGLIVELGCGEGSTHIINHFTQEVHKIMINAISLESDEKWLLKFSDYIWENHRMIKINHWSEIISRLKGLDIGVLFVDQGLWESRKETIETFTDAELVILHDSDYLERELGMNFSLHYKHVKTFMPLQPYPYVTGPPTTIMSNYQDVTKWEINYEDYV